MERRGTYSISAVAEMFGVHQQTLRAYERQGLITPERTPGNTRRYTEENIEELEIILNLTRELGVNRAGVEVILHMRKQLAEMRLEAQDMMRRIYRDIALQKNLPIPRPAGDLLVPEEERTKPPPAGGE
ncbi:MAG TPA: MerR family transcriptional regulator [bacterium]|jgi:MerR family transcriptional regulator/heat shock protein HspR